MKRKKPKSAQNPNSSTNSDRQNNAGASPDATGGAGITFERRVAIEYLTLLLTSSTATELGDGRWVTKVSFQQAPKYAVDDLVIHAEHPEGLVPTRVLALAIRRAPRIVQSNEESQKLIRQFVHEMRVERSDDEEHRFGLVVSGSRADGDQLAQLVSLAKTQTDASEFFKLLETPGKSNRDVRRRLDHLTELVELALTDLDTSDMNTKSAREIAWKLLSRLIVLTRRLETPDETDWMAVINHLVPVARNQNLDAGMSLRSHLNDLVGTYEASAAQIDLKTLRRNAHAFLDSNVRRHQHAWQTLERFDQFARDAVHTKITGRDDERSIHFERSELRGDLLEKIAKSEAVIVWGESGVGKSAIAVIGFSGKSSSELDDFQILRLNLRDVPKLAIDFETKLGLPLEKALSELSAPQRVLVIDGADAVSEDKGEMFRYLADAARNSGTKLVAVVSTDSKQLVLKTVNDCFGDRNTVEWEVPVLSDEEIDALANKFRELRRLCNNSRSRELLRRLVVVRLLVGAHIAGTPLTDADAMSEIWSGLIRSGGIPNRGSPDARETALLKMAELELGEGNRLEVINSLDSVALDGLRRDGLLRDSSNNPFLIGPEFGHDEVRRYAVARLLLADEDLTSRLVKAGAPRWALAAARLACQAQLAASPTATATMNDPLGKHQVSFDELVTAGYSRRWGDVPCEALLTLSDPKPLLRRAWTELLANRAFNLRRLVRLIDHHHRDKNRVIDIEVVEPLVHVLLDDPTPWRLGEYVVDILRAWLRAHVIAGTPKGHTLRRLLQNRLVEFCEAADRNLEAERKATSEEKVAVERADTAEQKELLERLKRQNEIFAQFASARRRESQLPIEIKDPTVLELLALLGADLGNEGKTILQRVADDAPWCLGHAVDELLTGEALAAFDPEFLCELVEAYYLDDEATESHTMEQGIREHISSSLWAPLAGRTRGPFQALFLHDFVNGVAVTNRLLNHAARFRAGKLTMLYGYSQPQSESNRRYEHELHIDGEPKVYVGDENVWRWYRGNAVGPYPCMSALQALEAHCDLLIQIGVPIKNLVSILLRECENLAMVGMIVGLLERHLEKAEGLLDLYIVEPTIWELEFSRATLEINPLNPNSDLVAARERRQWSFRHSALSIAMRADADEDRVAELKAVGESLVNNARKLVAASERERHPNSKSSVEPPVDERITKARLWASHLDRASFRIQSSEGGQIVEPTPPPDVVEALAESNEDAARNQEFTRLLSRYVAELRKKTRIPPTSDELVADLKSIKDLRKHPPMFASLNLGDIAASIAAEILQAYLVENMDLPNDTVFAAMDIIFEIADASRSASIDEYALDNNFYEFGSDRSVAKVIPLMLSPNASDLGELYDKSTGHSMNERAVQAAMHLAHAASYEVRLFIARGLDQFWVEPCTRGGRCHHDLGWEIVVETVRDCLLGPWDPETKRRDVITLNDLVTDDIANATADSIITSRLDAAIRALAPATTASSCISSQARELLNVLLAAQRRALLAHKRGDPDERETQSLVAARALLSLAENGDDDVLFEHISAYAEDVVLQGKTLNSLSSAAEETSGRAATARRIWPRLVRLVLDFPAPTSTESRHSHDSFFDERRLAKLIPNPVAEASHLYREVKDVPISWWTTLDLSAEVESWLPSAKGRPTCVDQLIYFLRTMSQKDQVQVGLSWVASMVLPDAGSIAARSYEIASWLIEIRSHVVDTELMSKWQDIVDALVVAGDSRLADYSD